MLSFADEDVPSLDGNDIAWQFAYILFWMHSVYIEVKLS